MLPLLNHRSVLHDFEMNVLLENENLSSEVLEMLEQDIFESSKITKAEEFHEIPKVAPFLFFIGCH